MTGILKWRGRTGKDKTFWARGYYVGTVGMNEATIKKYIQDQEAGSQIKLSHFAPFRGRR